MRIGIATAVVSASSSTPRRIRYRHKDRCLIPEVIVLRRWQEKTTAGPGAEHGIRYDGCRLPPGTWTLLAEWLREGLSWGRMTDPNALQECAVRSRTNKGQKLRAPHASKFAPMLGYLKDKNVLQKILARPRNPESPGLPDLCLYKRDPSGKVYDAVFVEVKRWVRRRKWKEPVSSAQKEELDFLTSLGLKARVLYLLE